MILKVVIWTIVLFMIFRFVFRFLLPLVTITKGVQDRMKQMQNQMDEMNQRTNAVKQKTTNRKVEGDYIDYEEVK